MPILPAVVIIYRNHGLLACVGARSITCLLCLVGVENLKESLVRLRLVAEPVLDGGNVRDSVVAFRRLSFSSNRIHAQTKHTNKQTNANPVRS